MIVDSYLAGFTGKVSAGATRNVRSGVLELTYSNPNYAGQAAVTEIRELRGLVDYLEPTLSGFVTRSEIDFEEYQSVHAFSDVTSIGIEGLSRNAARSYFVGRYFAGADTHESLYVPRDAAVDVKLSFTGRYETDKSGRTCPDPVGHRFYFANTWEQTIADYVTALGRPTDAVLVGDWNGDRRDSIGLRRGNTYYLTNQTVMAETPVPFTFGRSSDETFVGDWDGDGVDTVGVRRGNTFYLSNGVRSRGVPTAFTLGRPGDEVIVGDWDGDGTDTISVRRGNAYYLSNTNTGRVDQVVRYGRANDQVYVGDFDGNGTDMLAMRRGNLFYVKNSLGDGKADTDIRYGRPTDVAYIGDWDGNGTDTPVVRRD